ncbi:hypothetical protein KHA94_16390 [Bacillus sp. FJAT-49705]|uniref:Uncharacterized protein n=1 Tax=Cytobacillus citreus TaxID=2833586 RepID=A0ABS5NVC1_9BACI|nr:hypothetical protein [Cytobacillus citreus]MBS4191770.1 hypothetical protein [Cytobacillus citreus]
MVAINWMTVIVSVVASTITAIIVAKFMLDKILFELNNSDDRFLKQLELLRNETLSILKKKTL